MADKPRRKRYAEWPGATEYQRRQARGRALGLTPSQAAGKPKRGETPAGSITRAFRRVWDGLFGKAPKEPRRAPGVFDGGRLPPRPPRPPVAPPPPPEPEDQGGWWDRVPPEESGIPPGPEESAFDRLASDMGIGGDAIIYGWDGREVDPEFARQLLFEGWFDPFETMDRRAEAREQFFDYTGMALHDFDWDQWREWYGEAA